MKFDGAKYSNKVRIECTLNGLPQVFAYNGYYSYSSLISCGLATLLYKNDVIKDEDIIGNYKGESTIDLNGNITDGTYLNLKEIEFADFKLTNVRVWVTCETEEQLMLNKEELGRLGAISTWGNGLKIVR